MNDDQILSEIIDNYTFSFKTTGSNKSKLSSNILSIDTSKGFILNDHTYLISLGKPATNPINISFSISTNSYVK